MWLSFEEDDAYPECGTAVKFLVETHGKDKLMELLKEIHAGEVKSDSFNGTFAKVYGFAPEYAEFMSRWKVKSSS